MVWVTFCVVYKQSFKSAYDLSLAKIFLPPSGTASPKHNNHFYGNCFYNYLNVYATFPFFIWKVGMRINVFRGKTAGTVITFTVNLSYRRSLNLYLSVVYNKMEGGMFLFGEKSECRTRRYRRIYEVRTKSSFICTA